ncbi:MAG: TonB-dependent receptor plug domain-containing protein, partial [Bacteroidaceae bacterium]|nr:TonB-dependent receptor plug domain-containing protein [Bacteroidaceae bacterium]
MKKTTIILMMLAASLTIAAQRDTTTFIVKGSVCDAATGDAIPGVIVEAYGNNKFSAMTDETGKYEVKVPHRTSSVMMRVDGYNIQQCAVGKSHDAVDARMYTISFSSQYNRTTSASKQKETSQFDNSSVESIDPFISERLGADVRSISRGANVGLGNMMLINGINSLQANAQPLIVIDGVVTDMQYSRSVIHDGYYNNLLANINVNDIEKVTVLKNGTAIYGAKGANGVLLIQTKRNKSMATKIDVTINGRYDLIPKLPEMMNAEDYRLYSTELLASTPVNNISGLKFLNNDPTYYYYKQYHNNTDWTKEVYHNTFSQNYGINVQGGDDVANYNLSVGYSYANSTLKDNDFSRFNMRLNTDIELLRNLTCRFDASYSDINRDLRDDGVS